jgi:hypothetical protein
LRMQLAFALAMPGTPRFDKLIADHLPKGQT